MPVTNRSAINTAVAPSHSVTRASWEAAPSSSTNGTITNGVGVAFNASVDISMGVGDNWLVGVCICVDAGVVFDFGVAVTVSVLSAAVTGVVFGFGVMVTFNVVTAAGTEVSLASGT